MANERLVGRVEISSDMVIIRDHLDREIVSWHEDEFRDDSSSIMAAINAVNTFYIHGVERVANMIGKDIRHPDYVSFRNLFGKEIRYPTKDLLP